MKALAFCLLTLTAAASALAQNITLTDGTVIVTKGVRRLGDAIMATVQLPPSGPGQPAALGEFGYPVSKIAKIDFPDPGLNGVEDLINAGKSVEALGQLQTVLNYYDHIGDAPGSWWPKATLLKEQALISLGRYGEAAGLAELMARNATDPDSVRAANVYEAAAIARGGDHAKALEIYDAVLRDATRPETLAAAALYKGESHLARAEWEPALLSLLQVPVFYPEEKILMPEVLLGSGQAYIGLKDFPRAEAALNELTSTYALTPEAELGRAEQKRLAKLEKALAPEK